MSTTFRPYTPSSQRADRSAQDRQRHIRKVKESIRDNIGEILSDESIIGKSGDKVIKVPIRSVKEYRFVYGENSPQVSEGNGKQKPGDVVQKGKGDKKAGQGKAGNSPGEDAIETDITLESLIDLMFEDLELPMLERKALKKIVSSSAKKRRGKRRTGIRARLDKRATAKNRIRRGFAARGRSAPLPTATVNPDLNQEKEERFPFHKDDIRYHHIVNSTKEESNAVVFCIMDTSGSMGNTKKYLARSFYFLLYQFVKQRYQTVEVVFIAHHTEAKEVSERDFFHKVESGGTYISSGYNKALEIIEDRYHPSLWNVYAFHCSDGDNFYSDNERAIEAANKLCEACNLFGYGEIKPSGSSYYSGSMLEVYNDVKHENFRPLLIEKKEDLWTAFKGFLDKNKQERIFFDDKDKDKE